MKKKFLLYLCLLFCISCLFSFEYHPIDGWNACLSTDGIIDLYKPILFFYKVDKSYSRAESLTDWNSFYYNK